MKVPELLTKVKNKVKNSPHLPDKYKVIMYHLLKKVFEEWKAEALADQPIGTELSDFDMPDIFKDIFRDRSKQ